MKKDEKRRKKKLERRARRKAASGQPKRRGLAMIRQAAKYPIEGCWIHKGWDEIGEGAIVIVRRSPNGRLIVGVYLIDRYCLGLKDTFCKIDMSPAPLGEFLEDIYSWGESLRISPALAHEIIYGGIEYAAQFGFRPHPDFQLSRHLLDPQDMHPRSGEVTFGYHGKPLYISGPHDDVEAIVSQLMATAGPGNFDYIIQFGSPPDEWLDGDRDLAAQRPELSAGEDTIS